jgi:hypothetical protein
LFQGIWHLFYKVISDSSTVGVPTRCGNTVNS